MPVHVVERSQRQSPALGAVLIRISQQAEVAEEDVNVLAIGDGTGRRRRTGGLITLQSRARGFPPPEDLAGDAAQSERVQLAALIDHLFATGVSPGAPSAPVMKIRSRAITGDE